MIDRVDWSWVLGISQEGIFGRYMISTEMTTFDTCLLRSQELKERRIQLWLFVAFGQWIQA